MRNKTGSKQRRAKKADAKKLAAAHAEIASLKKTIEVITQIALDGEAEKEAEHQKEKAELLRMADALVDEVVKLRRAKDARA